MENVNTTYGKFPKDDERMDYDHAIRVLEDLVSCLSVLLATEGYSQRER